MASYVCILNIYVLTRTHTDLMKTFTVNNKCTFKLFLEGASGVVPNCESPGRVQPPVTRV